MKGILLVILVTSFVCSSPATHNNEQTNPDTFQSVVSEFESQIEADLKTDNLHSSISVAIIKGDRVIWSKAFGYADKESNIRADTNTIYRIGSITKTFTATLMMILAEEGKIRLSDPVEMYVPEVKNLQGYSDSTKITLSQLASHTSGLAREPHLASASSGPIDKWEQKVTESIPKTSFESKPGEKFNYSNIGYAILGLALSRAAGEPYMQLIQEKIFDALQMKTTFFIVPEKNMRKLAEGIENNANGTINTEIPYAEHKGRGYRVPNGGIYSTPNDLAKFIISNMGFHSLLTQESLELMQTIKTPGTAKYGYGLEIRRGGGQNIIWHNGSVPGYTAQFAIEKDSKYAVILLRNFNAGTTKLEKCSFDLLKKLNTLPEKY